MKKIISILCVLLCFTIFSCATPKTVTITKTPQGVIIVADGNPNVKYKDNDIEASSDWEKESILSKISMFLFVTFHPSNKDSKKK